MLGILEDIKQKSVFFGESEGFEMSDTDIATFMPDVSLSDESKAIVSMIEKSSNSDDSSIGIKKDYTTDEGGTTVFQENLEVINPDQIYEVQCDDEMKQLLENNEGGWKYVTTLKALVESCSEEEEDGEKTEITEVKQCGTRIDVRRFYENKFVQRTARECDAF